MLIRRQKQENMTSLTIRQAGIQAPETQSEALKQLIALKTKLKLELKYTISHQKCACEGITFDCSNIFEYFTHRHLDLCPVTRKSLRRCDLAKKNCFNKYFQTS